MFFGHRGALAEADPYALYIEAARFADENDFSSLWIPERHFTELGCTFPNPAVLHAALARETKRIRLCAGSVVVPLHHPVTIAENWAMVDKLSGGRVGLAMASGWHADDFVLRPENYAVRHKALYDDVELIRRLWRGEPLESLNGLGKKTSVKLPLRPLQAEVPIWITSAGNNETLTSAGASGFNLLTHTFNNDLDTLASKIALYRSARRSSGHSAESGRVTVMVHTFMGGEREETKELLREPYREYLKSNRVLMAATGQIDSKILDSLSDSELNDIADFVFERLYNGRALLGTPESCMEYARKLQEIGVNEVACLLDFGIESKTILKHLPFVNDLRKMMEKDVSANPTLGASHPTPSAAAALSLETSQAPIPLDQFTYNITSEDYYRELDARATEGEARVFYGRAFRCIKSIHWSDSRAMGLIELGKDLIADAGNYQIHPVLWDNAFQILAILALKDDAVAIHTGYKKLRVFERASGKMWVVANLVKRNRELGELVGDLRILSETGDLLAIVDGLTFKYIQQTVKPAAAPVQPARISDIPSPDNILDIVRNQLGETLGYPPESLDLGKQILDLGVDSLIALEVKNKIDRELNLSLPVVSLLSNPTISQLGEAVYGLVIERSVTSGLEGAEEITL